MADGYTEIPNTRHVPQENSGDDVAGASMDDAATTAAGGAAAARATYGTYRPGSGAIPNTTDPILQLIDDINREDGPGGTNGALVDADGNKVLSGEDKFLAELGRMQGLNTSFSHSNKWVGYFPLANVLGKKYSNLEMNLTRFSVPQIVMGSTFTSFQGYQLELPTHLLDSDSKEIVIEYIIDEKWVNYKSLYMWCSATEGQINKVADTSSVQNISMKDFVDCRIWLIDSFKNRIIDFVFENCWVKSFQELSLEANNPEEVHHTVTLAYSNFYIDGVGNR